MHESSIFKVWLGLVLYVFVVFGLPFRDGSGNGFLVIFGWILGAVWLQKSMKSGIDFGSDF